MTKTFRLDGLDCPACAAKLERAIKALGGVSSASVNFMTAKLTVESNGGSDDSLDASLRSAVKKFDPDITLKKA